MNLKKVLLANSLFSFLSGLIMIAANTTVTETLGIENGSILYFIGFGLILFAGTVRTVAINRINDKRTIQVITIADFSWVAGSIIVLIIPQLTFSQMGIALILLVATIVGIFGLLQLKFNP